MMTLSRERGACTTLDTGQGEEKWDKEIADWTVQGPPGEHKRGQEVISVSDLRKDYEGGLIQALRGISFDVARGEVLSIMGPSGCGKSTLFNLLGAMDLPTEGTIRFQGRNLAEFRPFDRFRARNVGFVFQLFNLIPALTLLENVEAPMAALSVPKKDRRERAARLLAEVGLSGRMQALPTKISGGERQRVAIARALANDPPLILADEPTGSLDTETGGMVLDLLMSRCRGDGRTLIVATHNQEVAARSDRVLQMSNGLLAGA